MAETVRRQLLRPFSRSATTEEEVIRERFSLYVDLAAPKIETMRPLTVITDEIVALILRSVDHASSLRIVTDAIATAGAIRGSGTHSQ